MSVLHTRLDFDYPGDDWMRAAVRTDALNVHHGTAAETPLHVAARRRRLGAVEILLSAGADADARNAGRKTAWQHARRRGFTEICEALEAGGADTALDEPDVLAVALTENRLDDARTLLRARPELAHTGNPEEDRLLGDIAGRNGAERVDLLVRAGADLEAPSLDGGTPLHIACWFGQPENARILVNAGARLDPFDPVHESSPIGWVAHGSRFSGGAEERQEVYVELARILLEAGCSLSYPSPEYGQGYLKRLLDDATPGVAAVIREYQ